MATDVEAQIAGNVWKIERAVGDTVGEEDVLLIIESMKMEIPVESPCSGRIVEICVQEGDSIDQGDPGGTRAAGRPRIQQGTTLPKTVGTSPGRTSTDP